MSNNKHSPTLHERNGDVWLGAWNLSHMAMQALYYHDERGAAFDKEVRAALVAHGELVGALRDLVGTVDLLGPQTPAANKYHNLLNRMEGR